MKRLWEIDFSRGIAIILMILFNYSFALRYLGIYTIGNSWFFWFLFPRIIGGTFITISGISLVLNRNKDYISRGLKILALGMLITLATYIYAPNEFIVFGILHLIGTAMIFAIPFLRFKNLNFIIGMVLIFLGMSLQTMQFNFPWLLWLGFIPENFHTLDYFPLLPWFGLTLIGLFLGKHFYKKSKRNFKISDLSNKLFIKQISFLGRHSLKIYLLHQPLLLVILSLLGFSVF